MSTVECDATFHTSYHTLHNIIQQLLRQFIPFLCECTDEGVLSHFICPNGEKIHQRQSISLETKIAILDRLGKGEGSTAIGKHFNLGESTVRAIKKNEAAIRKSVISGTKLSTKFASYTRDVLLERTERAIAIWIEEQVQRRIPVSGYLIQEKALQFYKSMKLSEPSTYSSQAGKEFSASKGWLTGFFKRNALHNIKIKWESATADKGAAKIFPEELAKIIEDGDYSVDQTVDGVVGLEGDDDEEEKSTPLTGKLIQEGLQLCRKLEIHFLINDPNSERASKLQQTFSSDDEGDLEPLRKRCKPLSDSDND
ncbi:tigger transposable element-derived protein 1 [Trichonephila clavipes]|nr:tigger transposable element-derived protein 1 [Trichonephila clavipes]